jgi:uncharacterized protein
MKTFERSLAILARRPCWKPTITQLPPHIPIRLKMGSSCIHNIGSFAIESTKQGDCIGTMGGEVINFREVLRRIKKKKLTADDPLQIGGDLFLDLDTPSMAINHGCTPNVGVGGVTTIIALRDIEAGEEVIFDYSTTVSANIDPASWSMKCHCGSQYCRSLIQNVTTVPNTQLLEYNRLGALQTYIVDELSERGML